MFLSSVLSFIQEFIVTKREDAGSYKQLQEVTVETDCVGFLCLLLMCAMNCIYLILEGATLTGETLVNIRRKTSSNTQTTLFQNSQTDYTYSNKCMCYSKIHTVVPC